MSNVWRILKRDCKRLIKHPAALLVVGALLILPSIYSWYNVVAFWNPYDNTGNMRVCIVNNDEGGYNELTGEIKVGDLVVDALKENSQLKWDFVSEEDAFYDLRVGKCYAVFKFDSDFTEKLLTLTTGNYENANIKYYVNEKLGPVSPKVTDTGSTTLEETINSTFISTLSDVLADTFDKGMTKIDAKKAELRDVATDKLQDSLTVVSNARTAIGDANSGIDEAIRQVENSYSGLDRAKEDINSSADSLSSIADLTDTMSKTMTDLAKIASPAVSTTISSILQAQSTAHEISNGVNDAVSNADTQIGDTITNAQNIINSSNALITQLEQVESGLTPGSNEQLAVAAAIKALKATSSDSQASLDNLEKQRDAAKKIAEASSEATKAFDSAVTTATNNASAYSDLLFGTTIPAVSEALTELSKTTANLSSSIREQTMLIDQTKIVVTQLDDTLKTSQEALSKTDEAVSKIEDKLKTIQTDVLALRQSNLLKELFGVDGLDASKIADFMGEPTQVETEKLYELNAYGSAMAPLFMNLTFWIGPLMLLVIMRQEADGEGIKNIHTWQRHIARFILFAAFAIIQAVIDVAGILLIGVQASSVVALYFAAIVAALAYLSICFMLSTCMQHIGKGLYIVLVFAQIPGATGLYPIEMTSQFFRSISPYFPFTYGINAMREAIFGIYGNAYLIDMIVLMLIFTVCLGVGLALRPLLANVNRTFSRQLRQTEMFNAETMEVPARRFRITQLIKAITDAGDYALALQIRKEKFEKLYPKLIRGAIIAGIALPVLSSVVFAFNPSEKTSLLTAWLVIFVLLLVFVVFVENFKESLKRLLDLSSMSVENMLDDKNNSITDRLKAQIERVKRSEVDHE